MPTNAIVVSADHILPGPQTVSQLGINNSLPSHPNTTQLGKSESKMCIYASCSTNS